MPANWRENESRLLECVNVRRPERGPVLLAGSSRVIAPFRAGKNHARTCFHVFQSRTDLPTFGRPWRGSREVFFDNLGVSYDGDDK